MTRRMLEINAIIGRNVFVGCMADFDQSDVDRFEEHLEVRIADRIDRASFEQVLVYVKVVPGDVGFTVMSTHFKGGYLIEGMDEDEISALSHYVATQCEDISEGAWEAFISA